MMVKRRQLDLLGLNMTTLYHIESSSNYGSITRRFMEVVYKTLIQNSRLIFALARLSKIEKLVTSKMIIIIIIIIIINN